MRKKTDATKLTAAAALYERGFNDALDFLVKYITVTYDREYDD